MPKILAIDDDVDVLIIVSAMLNNYVPGCRVLSARSGDEGIEMARTEQPDTILLDIKLPGIDGFEVCRKLKSDESTRHIPVIMLTGAYAGPESRIKSLEIGADSFLSKPVDKAELIAQVKVALRIKQAEELLRRENRLLEEQIKEKVLQLQERESAMRALLNATPHVSFLIGIDGTILAINETGVACLGGDQGETVGMNIYSRLPPDVAKARREHVERAVRTGKPVRFEDTRDEKIFDHSICPVEGPNGQVVQIAVFACDITEQRHFERVLRESEEKYRTFFETSKDAVCITSRDGRWIEFNDAALRLLGYQSCQKLQEVKTSSLYADPEERRCTIKDIKEFGAIEERQVDFRKADGTIINVLLTFVARRDKKGSIIGYQGTIRDITERKRAESELMRYKMMVSAVGHPMAFVDRNHIYLAVNEAYKTFFKRTYGEIIGFSVEELFGREMYYGTIKENLDRTLSGEEVQFDYWFDYPDGKRRYMNVSYYPFYQGNGCVEGVVISARDVTSLKEAEVALRESEQIFHAVFDQAFQLSGLLTVEGILLEANTTALEFVETEKSVQVGKPLWDTLWWKDADDEMRKRAQDAVRRAAGGETVRFETASEKRDGRIVYSDFSIKPVKNTSGEIVFLIAEGRDITSRKQAEEQIKTSLREKEVLLREVHHRVKNNMQVISSLLNLQSRHIKDQDALTMFRESQGRIRAMSLIHERLYRTSDLAHIDFRDYIRDLAGQLFTAYRASFSNVKLESSIEGVLLDINCAIPVGLIINELVSNSLKHAFPGKKNGTINIAMREDGGQVELVVSDDGIGIGKNFDFDNITSLGMQLVTALTQQLSGAIDLETNSGTTWKLTFPIKG